MKKVIIGIHGLKNKPSKRVLEEWWKLSMMEGLVAIGKYRALPDFELVYWADAVYDKPLNPDITNEKDPYFLHEFYTPATTGYHPQIQNIRRKVMGFIVRNLKWFFLNNDLSLRNRTVAESIVQRYFKELNAYYKEPCGDENCIQCRARKIMVERVVSVLRKYKRHDIFLIGHSMGSILGFDAACFEVPDVAINTFVTIGSPIGLPLVISKIASRQNITQDGKVILQAPASIKKHWYNFYDLEDYIALNCMLSTEFSQNKNGVTPIDVRVKNNYMMNNKANSHGAYGYLRAKAFAEVLAAFLEEKEPDILQSIWKWIISIPDRFIVLWKVFLKDEQVC